VYKLFRYDSIESLEITKLLIKEPRPFFGGIEVPKFVVIHSGITRFKITAAFPFVDKANQVPPSLPGSISIPDKL